MSLRIPILVMGLIAASTFATGTAASPASGSKAASPYPMDCTQWKDPARCAGFNDKIAACRDKTDDAWLQCMYPAEAAATFNPPKPRDCSHASNKPLCESHTAALEACRDKTTRAEHRECMAAHLQTAAFKGR